MRARPRVARQALVTAAITIAGLTLAAGAPQAQAAPSARVTAPPKPTTPIHCVRNLSRAGAPTTCYNTFTQAIAAATGGRIADAPSDTRVAMRDRRLLAKLNAPLGKPRATARRTAGDVAPITILFQHRGFNGASLVYTGARDCTASLHDVDYGHDRLDFEFGSFRAYRGCRLKLFEKPGWTGASTDFRGIVDNVFNLRWTPRSMLWS
jgi:hypothetical protein